MGAQAAKLSGATEKEGIQDINFYRLKHASGFEAGISDFQSREEIATSQSSRSAFGMGTVKGMRVVVRKRPINDKELGAGAFDVLSRSDDTLWVHRCDMRLDGVHKFIDHNSYTFDAVYDQHDDSKSVYQDAVAPIVAVALQGGLSTAMCFGQTGSGKTFTMAALSAHAATDIYRLLAEQGGGEVSMHYVEVVGTVVKDVLNEGAPIKLLQDASGELVLKGVSEHHPQSAEELLGLIQRAAGLRSSCETGTHDASSRSHALCCVTIHGKEGSRGQLRLVDLAGDEWAADQETHSKERIREAAAINSSLMVLKACIRAKRANIEAQLKGSSKRVRAPYRETSLTRLLQGSFMEDKAEGTPSVTVVLTTVSPCCLDTNHSMSTLFHTSSLLRADADKKAAYDTSGEQVVAANVKEAEEAQLEGREMPADPVEWSASEVCVWWVDASVAVLRQLREAEERVQAAGQLLLEVPIACDTKLGIVLAKAPKPPAVLKITPSGAAQAAALALATSAGAGAGPRLQPGFVLRSVQGQTGDAPKLLGAAIKAIKAAGQGVLALAFEPPPPGPALLMPRVPRVFTGESRLGTGDGAYLCEKYLEDLNSFLEACEGNKQIATGLFAALKAAWEPSNELRRLASAAEEEAERQAALERERQAEQTIVDEGAAASLEQARAVLWSRRLQEAEGLFVESGERCLPLLEKVRVARKEATEAQARRAVEGHAAAKHVHQCVMALRAAEAEAQVVQAAMVQQQTRASYARTQLAQLGVAPPPTSAGQALSEAAEDTAAAGAEVVKEILRTQQEQEEYDAKQEEARLQMVRYVRGE